MGQDEDAQPLVRRADFCRREQACRRRVAHVPKLSQHGFKAEGDVTGNVFEEDPLWVAFPDDTGDLGPEVPGVVCTATLSGRAEGLTGVTGEDDVEGTSEYPGIETAEIIPDRGWGEIPGSLGGDEDSARPVFPFDKGAGVIAGLGQHDAQIQASAACAEGQSVKGT